MGLAQVYAFMNQSSGTVEIASVLGEGYAVSLVFPRPQKSILRDKNTGSASRAMDPLARRYILLAEDDPDISMMTTEMLLSLGHQVVHRSSPIHALELLASESVDLVLSDVMMAGGMSGLDLARTIRSSRPSLQIIVATGFEASAEGVVDEGFNLCSNPLKSLICKRF